MVSGGGGGGRDCAGGAFSCALCQLEEGVCTSVTVHFIAMQTLIPVIYIRIIGKSISRGAEWRKFQLYSTFHLGVKGPQRMTSISAKTPYYSPWFLAKI